MLSVSHLNLIVRLNELLKAHLLLQVEAKFFQTAEDTVMMRGLDALVLYTAIYRCSSDEGAQCEKITSLLCGHLKR